MTSQKIPGSFPGEFHRHREIVPTSNVMRHLFGFLCFLAYSLLTRRANC